MTSRRFGGGATPPAASSPAPAQQRVATPPHAAANRPTSASPPQQQGPRVPSFARGSGLAPSAVPPESLGEGGGFEKRDQAYWDAHPLSPGTYEWDLSVAQIVEWSTGKLTVTLKVQQWDRTANRPGPHHERRIDWDHSRPDLMTKIASAEHAPIDGCDCPGCKGHRGFAYWRREIVEAYQSAGYPEASWPKDQHGHPMIPWWDLFFHQCHDGVFVPCMLRGTVTAQAGRQKWPIVKSIARLQTADGKPFQAPMPYAVPAALANDMRWSVAEEKRWGGMTQSADVAILDREGVPFPHAGLPTYKDLG